MEWADVVERRVTGKGRARVWCAVDTRRRIVPSRYRQVAKHSGRVRTNKGYSDPTHKLGDADHDIHWRVQYW